MTKIISGRVTGRIEGDFVVFLIGIRINKPWKPHKWLPPVSRYAKNAERAVKRAARSWLSRPQRLGWHNSAILEKLRSSRAVCSRLQRVALARLGRVQSTG
jgi:hypothetical protein